MGKSFSRKLHWAIYYTVYRMDPQETYKTHILVHSNLRHHKFTRPGFHLGAPKKRKVLTTSLLY